MEKKTDLEGALGAGHREAYCTGGHRFTVSEQAAFGSCPYCGARVLFDESGKTKEIEVKGKNHREVADVAEKLMRRPRTGNRKSAEFPQWAQAAAMGFGAFTLVFLMALVVASTFGHQVPPSSEFLLNSVLALGTALAFGFLGGDAAAKGRLPLPGLREHPIEFSVAGGVAVFVIVLVFGSWLSGAKSETDKSRVFPNSSPSRLPDGSASLPDSRAEGANSTLSSVANSLSVWDKGYPQMAALSNQPTNSFAWTRAQLSGDKIIFVTQEGRVENAITGKQIDDLPADQRKLIHTFEASMQQSFDRWSDLYPQLSAAHDFNEKRNIETKLRAEAGTMCGDLQEIVRFLGSIDVFLIDHYSAVRYVCSQFPGNGAPSVAVPRANLER